MEKSLKKRLKLAHDSLSQTGESTIDPQNNREVRVPDKADIENLKKSFNKRNAAVSELKDNFLKKIKKFGAKSVPPWT